ncbi:FT-interacting protein 4-like [Vicia villosa]|uniref:FT-interacting protein 4-like n=1 Tax=Vicia villosa TaxID=3911 RepID=UPI00273CBDEC|nr:FT-interacting protein 4-like [Vicia villosa]
MANQNQNLIQRKQREDFSLKETTPNINAGRVISGDRLPTAFDLVEQMQFLFARVVRAKDLPETGKSDTCNPFVEVKLGSFVGTTKVFEKNSNPEWNQVFAFSKERIQEQVLQIVVKEKDVPDALIGRVAFTISDIPMRFPPNSPLAPQWYKLENLSGVKLDQGELMVSVWMGTQADESFPDAWHSDATATSDENIAYTRSKVYISPRLWYLRVTVIQAQDLLLKNKSGNNGDIFIQGVLGNLALRSRPMRIHPNPIWNEDLMFVAAEPFDDSLLLSIEQGLGNSNKHESLGSCVIHLKDVERRIDATPTASVWYNLQKPKELEGDEDIKFSTKLNFRISLDGGYHVLDEATHYSSDLRPSSKYLNKPSIGVLELGILNAVGLSPMKKDRTDAYCVAKYGPKWVRTRTIVDSFSPRWNEQYTWEVYDPCTVITIVVFDNGNLHAGGKNGDGGVDKRIGKVRIRLSTLGSDRIYTHFYPLINLHTQGARKMGEIQLAVRFSCPSLLNVLQTYTQPLLPKMHYVCPLSMFQLDSLRNQAAAITIMRFRRAEPPLSKEVVEFMLDMRANVWSMRRGRAQFYRIASLLSGLVWFIKKFEEIRSWKSSFTTIASYIMFLFIIYKPGVILPFMFTILFFNGILNFRISGGNLQKRYDRLRGISGRVLAVMGDLATQGERVQALISWRDPRATALFLIFCVVAMILTFVISFRIIVFLSVTYVLRPPRFRFDLPAFPQNFLRRMPAKSDGML